MRYNIFIFLILHIMTKELFRSICLKYLPYYRKINLPIIRENNVKEAILIEFRVLPHIELLLRNAIFKLGSNWSYTIVCGNDNYDFVMEMVSNLKRKVKIIKLNKANVTINDYNNLLLSLDFWNLFVGQKLLLYQEDSFIFQRNINQFLGFDYVGAPWTHLEDYCEVGNGGLSLRTKSVMIEILTRYGHLQIDVPTCVRKDMKSNKLLKPPEDVFFSKIMKLHNIGMVPTADIAIRFSMESFVSEVFPFGGHQFWHATDKWDSLVKQNLYQTLAKNMERENIIVKKN